MLHIIVIALLVLTATASTAQSEFTAQVRDIGNLSTPVSETQLSPFQIDGTYSNVSYDITPDRGVDRAVAEFNGGSLVGVGLTARTTCDDFLITGPAGLVAAQVHVRLSASAANRPFSENISGRIISGGSVNQTFTITQPAGDSSYDADLLSNSGNYLVNTPFSFQTEAVVVVGGAPDTPIWQAQWNESTLKVGI